MIITILTTGTRGDTELFVALGVGLKKAGYKVRIAASEGFEPFVVSYGLEYYPTDGNILEMASSNFAKEGMKADNPIKVFLSLNKPEIKEIVYNMQKGLHAACIGADAIVYHPATAIGHFIAQHNKIPGILATPIPLIPTKDYPALIFYGKINLGRVFNYWSHKIFAKGIWMVIQSSIKKYLNKDLDYSIKRIDIPHNKQNAKKQPVLVACSNHVFRRASDWAEHIYSTGYWFLDKPTDWIPPRKLSDFLQKGKPPIYVGFGSIVDSENAAETTKLVLKALKSTNQRGILATGWGAITEKEVVSEDILFIESIPHSWLFPQMAAVIHHGGAGTTAAALRVGVPNIVIPFANDQFAWGQRAYELGVGAKPIPRKKLTTRSLIDAIEEVLKEEMKAESVKLGMKIQSEDGIKIAVDIIKKTLAK